MNQRYTPCFDCFNRYGREYTDWCDSNCEYAYAVKLRDSNIEDLNTIIKNLETQLADEKARTAKLIAENGRLDYDLGYVYQTICKLKGDHYV